MFFGQGLSAYITVPPLLRRVQLPWERRRYMTGKKLVPPRRVRRWAIQSRLWYLRQLHLLLVTPIVAYSLLRCSAGFLAHFHQQMRPGSGRCQSSATRCKRIFDASLGLAHRSNAELNAMISSNQRRLLEPVL